MINDNINNPSHYNLDGVECIDVMLRTQGINAVMFFCICNCFKYLYRHNYKNGLEDIKKAKWYLDKYLELEQQLEEQENKMVKSTNDPYMVQEDIPKDGKWRNNVYMVVLVVACVATIGIALYNLLKL